MLIKKRSLVLFAGILVVGFLSTTQVAYAGSGRHHNHAEEWHSPVHTHAKEVTGRITVESKRLPRVTKFVAAAVEDEYGVQCPDCREHSCTGAFTHYIWSCSTTSCKCTRYHPYYNCSVRIGC